MRFTYNVSKLQQLIHSLAALTNISIAFLDTQYRFLCKSMNGNPLCTAIQENHTTKCKCGQSDRMLLEKCLKSQKFECHICHAGLYDACLPIVKDDSIAGYVLMGQVRYSSSPAGAYGKTDPQLSKLYQGIPCFTDSQLDALKTLLPEILFQNTIRFDDSTSEIVEYIETHLNESLTFKSICKEFHISKNSLYRKFHNAHGCTVNAYVTRLRLEKAMTLLRDTSKPVYQISEEVGFRNYPYFCRLFKRQTGSTPGSYRTQNH